MEQRRKIKELESEVESHAAKVAEVYAKQSGDEVGTGSFPKMRPPQLLSQ